MSHETPLFYSEELSPREARELVASMGPNGFKVLETSMGPGEVVRIYGDRQGNEVLIIADLAGVEATADNPAGPIIRDRG